MQRQHQLPRLAEKADVLVGEIDIHLQFLQPPERHQEIHAVASEAADGLGVDHVDPARLAVGQEPPEAGPRADGPSRLDVGVGIDVFPIGILQDVLPLEVHLGREAVQLALHLRAHAAVQGHADALGLPVCWDDMYDGFPFLIRHDWSFVTRIVGDG